jgi:P-type Ca2+ transporter type 2C
VLTELGSDADAGLTTEEAQRRTARHGANEIASEPPTPAWRVFLAQFQNVLIALLLLAGAISLLLWFHEQETALPYDAMVIFAIVLFNGILGYLQESKAEHSVAAPW